MRTHAGDVFIVFFNVQRVGDRTSPVASQPAPAPALAPRRIRNCADDLGQQALLGIAEACAVFGYQADIVGVADLRVSKSVFIIVRVYDVKGRLKS